MPSKMGPSSSRPQSSPEAVELDGGDGAVARIEYLQLDGIIVGLPEPHNHVGSCSPLTVSTRMPGSIPHPTRAIRDARSLRARPLTRLGVAAAPVIGHLGGYAGTVWSMVSGKAP